MVAIVNNCDVLKVCNCVVLENEEKLAAIAYFQNFWDDETYRQWEVMGGAR